MAMTVPPIRKSMGWKPADRIPTTFPRQYLLSPFRLIQNFKIESAVLIPFSSALAASFYGLDYIILLPTST